MIRNLAIIRWHPDIYAQLMQCVSDQVSENVEMHIYEKTEWHIAIELELSLAQHIRNQVIKTETPYENS